MDIIENSGIRQQADMSLDAASSTRGADDLVPSRYALRIGEIEVLVISDGVLPQPAATIGTNADPAELAAWLDDMRMKPDEFKAVFEASFGRLMAGVATEEFVEEMEARRAEATAEAPAESAA